MSTDTFYADLPVLNDFAATTDRTRYTELPDDWYLLISDVSMSTQAIEDGKYKHVNLVGASTIAAVLNAVKPIDVPFVFGGDGATLAVPPSVIEPTRAALLAARRMAALEFGLDLRVAVVPVGDIHATGARCLVARFGVSKHYEQAVFTGGGLGAAESLIKDPERGRPYRMDDDGGRNVAGDFAGLECRWDDIPSPYGETITLLVRASADDPDEQSGVYRQVLDAVDEIYGDAETCRPVRLDTMRITHSREKLTGEVRVRSHGRTSLGRLIYRAWLRIQMIVGHFVFKHNATFNGVDWGRYRRDVVINTDFRKFDDMLRQVIVGTQEQRERLAGFLEERRAAGELTYGIHAAPSALMTCLVFTRSGNHVHFVDGSAGGYAMAAKQMKAQHAR